jgi:hypothetical protein
MCGAGELLVLVVLVARRRLGTTAPAHQTPMEGTETALPGVLMPA